MSGQLTRKKTQIATGSNYTARGCLGKRRGRMFVESHRQTSRECIQKPLFRGACWPVVAKSRCERLILHMRARAATFGVSALEPNRIVVIGDSGRTLTGSFRRTCGKRFRPRDCAKTSFHYTVPTSSDSVAVVQSGGGTANNSIFRSRRSQSNNLSSGTQQDILSTTLCKLIVVAR